METLGKAFEEATGVSDDVREVRDDPGIAGGQTHRLSKSLLAGSQRIFQAFRQLL